MALASSSAPAAEVVEDEIAFFDVETSVLPNRCALLEFGAVVVCPRRLVEVSCYSTLVRPAVPASTTARCNGITRDTVARAPPFRDVADDIYRVLHAGKLGKLFWSREAKAQEASPRKVHTIENLIEGAITRTQANGTPPELSKPEAYSRSPNSLKRKWTVSPVDGATIDGHNHDPARDRASGELVVFHGDKMMLETATQMDAGPSGYSGFLEPDDVSTWYIKISVRVAHQFGPRTVIQHKGAPLQLCCAGLRVRFGVVPRFFDTAGRPKLNIVVDIPENLTKILGFCDSFAQWSSPEGCSNSEWIPLIKSYGNSNCPTVRLNIPIIGYGENAAYTTHMYQKGRNGDISELIFRKVDAAELDSLLRGNKVDAFFSLEIFDYRQTAGIRLVAKRLDVHFKRD
nr:unnamed protein product [Digitaria exilis]